MKGQEPSFKQTDQIFPIDHIENGFIVAKNGDITAGWEILLPEIFSLDVNGYNSLYESFANVFTKLAPGITVHQQEFVYLGEYDQVREIKSFCLVENEKSYLGRPVLNHYIRLYITFPNDPLRKITAEKNIAIKLSRMLFEDIHAGSKKIFYESKPVVDSVSSSLASIRGVDVERMKDKDLFDATWDYWNLSFNTPGDYRDGASLPPYSVSDGFIRIGGKFVGVVSWANHGEQVTNVKEQRPLDPKVVNPNTEVERDIHFELGTTYPLRSGLPFNHIINTFFTVQKREKAYVEYFFRSLNEGIAGNMGWDMSKKKMADIAGFKEAVSNRGFKICKAGVNVIVIENELQKLQDNLQHTINAFDNITTATPWIETMDALPLFVAGTPGYAAHNYRTFDTVVEHATCYLGFEGHYVSDMTGHLYMDRYGNPVGIDFWNPKHVRIDNRNSMIIGKSGSGKTYFGQGFVEEELDHGVDVVILDVGLGYDEHCKFNGGKFIDSGNREQLSLPFFHTGTKRDKDGNYILDDDKLAFIMAVLITMWKGSQSGATMEARSILADMVKKFYEHINESKIFPTFTEFYKYTDIFERDHLKEERKQFFSFDSLRTVYDAYVSGPYSDLLNSKEELDYSDLKYLVFDIKSVSNNKILFPVVALIIMELVMRKIEKLGGKRRVRFMIDEGWKVLNGDLESFVEYMFKTARKHEAAITFITQNPEDIEKSGIAGSMKLNMDTLVLLNFDGKENFFPILQRTFDLTDFQISLLKDLKVRDGQGYREFLLIMSGHPRIFRYKVSEKTDAVYTSKGAEKAQIRELFKKFGKIGPAINQYVENQKIKQREKVA